MEEGEDVLRASGQHEVRQVGEWHSRGLVTTIVWDRTPAKYDFLEARVGAKYRE